MTSTTKDDVLALLNALLAEKGMGAFPAERLSPIILKEGRAIFSLSVPPGEAPAFEAIRVTLARRIEARAGVRQALITLTDERAPLAPAPPVQGRAGVQDVKAIIAVASGKGGVGKSTTAVNLAIALAGMGLRAGLLDADIYGPSIPRLLALTARPETVEGKALRPLAAHGLKVMSIGFLVPEDTAMIWRGPMVVSALSQMLQEVLWGPLDVLVVDMPPGTGDAQLTFAQKVPLAGAVIVSTPQDLALIDARRAVAMFAKTAVPVLGIVENMSTFICPHCGGRSDPFGHGGAAAEAAKSGVPFLGGVPLTLAIRETSDAGRPIVVAAPESAEARAYAAIAEKTWQEIVDRRAAARPPPRIVME